MSTRSPAAMDRFGRRLGTLRLSVTDRCNMRCRYCMPEPDYVWLPRSELLTFEELERLAAVFCRLGVGKIRLTGGEPLLRHDLASLVAQLAKHTGDLALTTNGILLEEQAPALKEAGLSRVTVSLDTLEPDRLARFAKTRHHARILAGITGAIGIGLPVKLNVVVIRGYNDDELSSLLRYGERYGVEVRFIEYMDVGGATRWSAGTVMTREEILANLRAEWGSVRELGRLDPASPAERFEVPGGPRFGIIASTTEPFCGGCDRVRLTADGSMLLCLYAADGIDLRTPLRQGETNEEITGRILGAWERRRDRGAEERVGLVARAPLYAPDSLRMEPHLEMHTRGG